MAVLTRPGSPYLWIWIPGESKKPENTKIPIGVTATEQRANRQKAELIISKRQLDAACRAAGLPVKDDKPTDATTFRTYAATYSRDAIPRHRGAYRERQILPRLVAAFGDLLLADPPSRWTAAVRAWRTKRLHTPTVVSHYGGTNGKAHTFAAPSPRTVNREVGFLKQILKAAVADGYLELSPLARFGALDAPPIRRRVATPDEETRILAQLDPARRAVYIMAVDGLVRLGDCLDVMRREDRGKELDIRYPKNGEFLTIRVSTRLRAALDAVPVVMERGPDGQDVPSPWYFPQLRKAQDDPARTRGFVKALARACEAAGVPYGKKHHGITFHWATRMTGATRMIRLGGDKVVKDVAQLGGWKTLSVLMQIYQETTTEDLDRIVELAAPGAGMLPTAPKHQGEPQGRVTVTTGEVMDAGVVGQFESAASSGLFGS